MLYTFQNHFFQQRTDFAMQKKHDWGERERAPPVELMSRTFWSPGGPALRANVPA